MRRVTALSPKGCCEDWWVKSLEAFRIMPYILRVLHQIFLLLSLFPSLLLLLKQWAKKAFLEGTQWSWAVASGPVCTSPGSFPPHHCGHLFWAFPTPRGPRKEEELETVLLFRSIPNLLQGLFQPAHPTLPMLQVCLSRASCSIIF